MTNLFQFLKNTKSYLIQTALDHTHKSSICGEHSCLKTQVIKPSDISLFLDRSQGPVHPGARACLRKGRGGLCCPFPEGSSHSHRRQPGHRMCV